MGILAKMVEIAKKGEFVIFGKMGYTVKITKMTNLVKNVKNRYFLTDVYMRFFKGMERSPRGEYVHFSATGVGKEWKRDVYLLVFTAV